MVKLVLIGGVYKPPKLDNFGPEFYPQGTSNGGAEGTSNGCGVDLEWQQEGPRMAAPF